MEKSIILPIPEVPSHLLITPNNVSLATRGEGWYMQFTMYVDKKKSLYTGNWDPDRQRWWAYMDEDEYYILVWEGNPPPSLKQVYLIITIAEIMKEKGENGLVSRVMIPVESIIKELTGHSLSSTEQREVIKHAVAAFISEMRRTKHASMAINLPQSTAVMHVITDKSSVSINVVTHGDEEIEDRKRLYGYIDEPVALPII